MVIYLAGGILGNNRKLWEEHARGADLPFPKTGHQILESFYYARNNPWMDKLIPCFSEFLLDSGCFTFMMDKSACAKMDLEAYTDAYIEYINRLDIKHFVEMDVDNIYGLKRAEQLRAKIERGTGKQPIPVWHVSRGKDYFLGMVKDYPYVAFGGMMSDGKSASELEKTFPWFIDKAHEAGAKIHGLGYTRIQGLHKYHFDSVDSTAWLYGNRGGFLYKFDPTIGDFKKIHAPAGKRLKSKAVAVHNFNEWVKFQKYALVNL